MRILFTAAPFRGHLNAVLPLAQAARRAGHAVTVATGADLGAELARRDLPSRPIGPTSAGSGTPMSLADFFDSAAARATDLLPWARAWQPDLVVSEELEFAGPVVAARAGVGLVVHGLGLAAAGDPGQFAASLDALGSSWSISGLAEVYLRAPYLSVCPPALRPPGDDARAILSLRPGLGEPLPGEELPQALDSLPYDDTAHLTLGTVFHRRHPDAMATAIAGLRDLPLNLVVTVGPGVAPDDLGKQPKHVLIERYLPHSLLLPRCRLVVSQGGAGILLGALAHGLPQLVLPQGADQFANGAAAADAGVAICLEGPGPTSAAIAAAADHLLVDPRFAMRAADVRTEIEAMPTAAQVVAELASASAR